MNKREYDRINRPLRGECVLMIARCGEDGVVECELADKFGRQTTLRKWMRDMVYDEVVGFALDEAMAKPTEEMGQVRWIDRLAVRGQTEPQVLAAAIQRHVHPAYVDYEIGDDGMISEETDEVHLVNGGTSYIYRVVPIPDGRRSFVPKGKTR